jgi:hypothetical protein
VVVGVVASVVGLLVLRRKLRAGWRPRPLAVGLATAGSIGGTAGLLLAWFGPPEVAAPLLGLAGGLCLGAAFSPGVPDQPGERSGEQIVADLKAEDREQRAGQPWSPAPFAPNTRPTSLRRFAGFAYALAVVCLVFVVIGPVRPQDTRLEFPLRRGPRGHRRRAHRPVLAPVPRRG